MSHRGNPWEAELVVSALEEGNLKLSSTTPRLFAEFNLTPEHFGRLLSCVQDRADAQRLAAHPNATAQVRAQLEARFGPLGRG